MPAGRPAVCRHAVRSGRRVGKALAFEEGDRRSVGTDQRTVVPGPRAFEFEHRVEVAQSGDPRIAGPERKFDLRAPNRLPQPVRNTLPEPVDSAFRMSLRRAEGDTHCVPPLCTDGRAENTAISAVFLILLSF